MSKAAPVVSVGEPSRRARPIHLGEVVNTINTIRLRAALLPVSGEGLSITPDHSPNLHLTMSPIFARHVSLSA